VPRAIFPKNPDLPERHTARTMARFESAVAAGESGRSGCAMTTHRLHQARLLQEFHRSGATIEDLARAWASIDGKRDLFDAERDVRVADAVHGHYLGYLSEAEELLARATAYARERHSVR
jgi:hypothetical protein